MKCPNCGAEALNNYCEYCGTKLGDNTGNGYQPFTYNYNYNYTNNYHQPFAANTGKYANPQHQAPPQQHQQQNPPYNPFFQQRQDGKDDTSRSEKSFWVCLLLCLFFGCFGLHRFYAGKIATGLLYLFTFWSIGIIGALIDLITIACCAFKDGKGKAVKP